MQVIPETLNLDPTPEYLLSLTMKTLVSDCVPPYIIAVAIYQSYKLMLHHSSCYIPILQTDAT